MERAFIEGLPCAGKSTLAKYIEYKGGSVIHELGRVIPPGEFPGNGATVEEVLRIDDWFIEKEHLRTSQNSGYFDRSYLTHLAYAYAYGKYKDIPTLGKTTDKYKRAIDTGLLPVPEQIIYIDIRPEESVLRQDVRVKLGHKALDPFWHDTCFLSDMKNAYETLLTTADGVDIEVVDALLATEDKYARCTSPGQSPTAAEHQKSIDLTLYVNLLERRQ